MAEQAGEDVFPDAGDIQKACILLERRKIAYMGESDEVTVSTIYDEGDRSYLAGFDLDWEELKVAVEIHGTSFFEEMAPAIMEQFPEDQHTQEEINHHLKMGAGSFWVDGFLAGMLLMMHRAEQEGANDGE